MMYFKSLYLLLIVIIITSCAKNVPDTNLKADDFVFIFQNERISLDAPFDNLSTKSAVIDSGGTDLGEVEAGDNRYHFYSYNYADFTIYASNALYNLKDRDDKAFYMSQLETVSDQVKTPRDIALGSSMDDIIEAYGHGSILEEEDHEEVFFDYYEKNLTFILEDGKVTGMRMVINVDATEVEKK